MLKRILTPFVLLLIYLQANAQNQLFGEHTKSLLKLSNKTTSFFVTNPVRFKDSTGAVVSVRSIVELEDRYMKKVKKLYGKELTHELVILLNDTTRDWAANIMLYAIYEVSAVTLKSYNMNNINRWRIERKEADVEKWRNCMSNMEKIK